MSVWLLENYLWIKALHLIAVMSWMAAMLYLPRLYVYHAGVSPTSPEAELLKIMEYRLLRYIMNPAMIATWVLGGLMIWANPDLFHQGWFHGKLTLVLILSGLHGALSKYRRQLADGKCPHNATFFRVINEVPTVLMIAIVILVIVKPF
jgi:protoporphyrinogen IX oxidase